MITYRIFKWARGSPIGEGQRHKSDYENLREAEYEFEKIVKNGWQGALEEIEIDENGTTHVRSVGSYLDNKFDGPQCWKNRARADVPQMRDRQDQNKETELLISDPNDVRAIAYQLLINGYTIRADATTVTSSDGPFESMTEVKSIRLFYYKDRQNSIIRLFHNTDEKYENEDTNDQKSQRDE